MFWGWLVMDTSLIIFQYSGASFSALLFFTVDWWWVHGARLVDSRVPALPISQWRFSPWEPAPGTVPAPSRRWSGSGLGRGVAGPRAQAQACSREGFSEEQLKCIPVYLFHFQRQQKGESRVWCWLEHLQGRSAACSIRSALPFWGPGSQTMRNFSNTNCLILSTDCLAVFFLLLGLCYNASGK